MTPSVENQNVRIWLSGQVKNGDSDNIYLQTWICHYSPQVAICSPDFCDSTDLHPLVLAGLHQRWSLSPLLRGLCCFKNSANNRKDVNNLSNLWLSMSILLWNSCWEEGTSIILLCVSRKDREVKGDLQLYMFLHTFIYFTFWCRHNKAVDKISTVHIVDEASCR